MHAFVDAIASQLGRLTEVSASQWLLRGPAAAAVIGALLLLVPGGPFVGMVETSVSLLVLVLLLAQSLDPDSDAGWVLFVALALLAAVLPDQGAVSLALAGLLLLVAHMAWAWAATVPVHGRVGRSAWRLWGRTAVPVMIASIAAGAVVLGIGLITLPSWIVLVGTIALVALVVVLTPLVVPSRRR